MAHVTPYQTLFGRLPNEPSSSILDVVLSVYTYDWENYLDKVNDQLQRSWSTMHADTVKQQEKQHEFEQQKLKSPL